ncbi:MAG: phage major capsid protein [Patescibacteria group bacterium]|nr:phage major capsid protein [Patescibacteria group bacterium]
MATPVNNPRSAAGLNMDRNGKTPPAAQARTDIEKASKPMYRIGDVVENTYSGSGLRTYIPGKVVEVREVRTPAGKRDAFGDRRPAAINYRYRIEFQDGSAGWADEDMLERSSSKSCRTDIVAFFAAVAKARDHRESGAHRDYWHDHVCKSFDYWCPVRKESVKPGYHVDVKDGDPLWVTKAALNEGSGSAGGYIVPPQISLAILRSLAEESFIFPRALKTYMNSRTQQLPFVDMTGTAALGQSPFFGGMQFTWQPEAVLTETEPKFGMLDLTAHNLTGFSTVSNQWLSDSGPGVEEAFVKLIARAAGWQFEYAFFQGTGTAAQMPLGIIQGIAPQTSVNVVRSAPSSIANTDIANMAGHLIPGGWRNAVWAVTESAIPKIAALSQFVLNGWHYHEGGAIGFIMTRPVFPTEKLPSLGNIGDLVLFDPSAYVVGVRHDVLVDASPHSSFPTNQTDFRVWLRGDGKPWQNGQVTLADGQTKASMAVILQ